MPLNKETKLYTVKVKKTWKNIWLLPENWKSYGTVIIILVRTVPKNLEKRLDEPEIKWKIQTMQITALLKSARIFRRVLEIRRDFLSLRLLEKKTISYHLCEKQARSKINNSNNNKRTEERPSETLSQPYLRIRSRSMVDKHTKFRSLDMTVRSRDEPLEIFVVSTLEYQNACMAW